MIDLDAIEAAARAATPGPWRAMRNGNQYLNVSDSGATLTPCSRIVELQRPWNPYRGVDDPETIRLPDADADFIAALSPDVVLALVAELRAGLETAHGRSLIRVIVERDALRRIISEAATSAGASVAPECSLEFLALLPREIALVVRSRDDAVAERDDLRRCLAETRDHMEIRDVVRAQRVMAARLERDEAWGEIARLRKVVQERDDERSAFVASVRSSSEAMAAHLREAEAALAGMTGERDDERAISRGWEERAREAERDALEVLAEGFWQGVTAERALDRDEALTLHVWTPEKRARVEAQAAQLRRWARGER